MLSEHICPQLDKLKEERKEYTEFTRVSRDLEKLSKLYVAWDYMRTEVKEKQKFYLIIFCVYLFCFILP